jgi:hypothetical protein
MFLTFIQSIFLIQQVWTQKCAVQKASVDVNISYYYLKKKTIHGQRGPGFFFIIKLILDYYFCLKSGPVFLFQIFIIAPLSLPRDIKLYH